jgi:hypothetical protein
MGEANQSSEVTLAVLSEQILTLTTEVRTLRSLHVKVAVQGTQINAVKTNIDDLESRINNWSTLNSLGVLAAGIIGFIFGPRQ